MAIDKIGSKALTDSSVVAADITPGTVTTTQLAGSITNAKLTNSTVTVNGTSIALGASGSIPAVSWQSVVVSDGSTVTTMVAGRGYFVNNTSAAGIVKLPAGGTAGDTIAIKDYAGNFGTNKLTIQRNGHNIQGVANDSAISTNRASLTLVYVDATKGWLYAVESNVADLGPTFVAATGGTVTTSGNFKVHVFTGDSNFVVSDGGSADGSNTVDYLVVAGGGSGGSSSNPGAGAGGAGGGFRVSNSVGCIAAPVMSPLANASGLPVSAQTYPVTVGGGGASSSTNTGCKGSDSVFSTITSTGGGFGGSNENGNRNGGSGGSGGGAGGGSDSPTGTSGTVGAGNTPPVSPSQGNAGGLGTNANPQPGPFYWDGGGGGGAGAVGAGGSPSSAAAGGIGSFVSTSFAVGCVGTPGPVGSTRYFAGGGGGGSQAPGQPNSNVGAGGAGGGTPGTLCSPNASSAGAANTGGGSGGNGGNAQPNVSGAGGKGIVIIRYKFQ